MPKATRKEGTYLGVHFYRSRHARIRELKRQHAPSVFGYRIWSSCWLLMDYLKALGVSPGARIMEVGCGWGMAGIFCARELGAEVTCVDADPEVFHYLRLHSQLNRVRIATLNRRFEDLAAPELAGLDLLIGADICFWDEMTARLSVMIDRALACGVGRIIIADPGRSSFMSLAAYCLEAHDARVFTLSVRKPYTFTGRLLVITGPPARV